MRFFDFFRRARQDIPSADTAKQRLQVILAYERGSTKGSGPDCLPLVQKEIIQVIRKYFEIDESKVTVDFERGDGISMLEVNIELPNLAGGAGRPAA